MNPFIIFICFFLGGGRELDGFVSHFGQILGINVMNLTKSLTILSAVSHQLYGSRNHQPETSDGFQHPTKRSGDAVSHLPYGRHHGSRKHQMVSNF